MECLEGKVEERSINNSSMPRAASPLLLLYAAAALQSVGPKVSLHFLVLSEDGWDAPSTANVSAALAAINATARGAGRVYYAQRVGGDPLEAFAHMVAADVLAISDSHFSVGAAQLSLGVTLRIRRRGFSAVDLQHMLPLPLLRGAAEARAHVRANRNRGCAEDEEALAARSWDTFSCRLRGYLGWRADFARQRAAERAAARMERANGGTGRSHRHCAV